MPRHVRPLQRSAITVILVISLMAIARQAEAGELPTPQEVLAIHRANKEKFTRLHLQLVQTYETTEASCRIAQVRADEREKLMRQFAEAAARGEEVPLKIDGRTPTEAEKAHLFEHLAGRAAQRELKRLRAHAKPFQSVKLIEFFKDGGDYQYRTPAKWEMNDAERAAWRFATATLSKASLVKEYADTQIFSRASEAKPAGRRWDGTQHDTAYITEGHLHNLISVDLPPMTDVTHPRWDDRHPYDGFFMAPEDNYRVVREELVDGRTLLVVDTETPPDNQSPGFAYRAWLDLARGAVPVKLYDCQITAVGLTDLFDHRQPNRVTRTEKLCEVAGGGYYPAKTVAEDFEYDPEAAKIPEAQWVTLPDGKREAPLAAMRRYTWECSLVEVPPPFADDFFVLTFPDDQKLYDHDAGRLIGALARKPLVKVGQQAPLLTIGLWLDGQQRTLEDLKGQVVVLDFWGLWCGACRGHVPQLKQLQEQCESGVTFISIHSAEKNPRDLVARIEQFAIDTGWKWLAAIDSGTMIENSVTATEYGVEAFPTTVIIGPDGKIVYVEPEFIGPDCDEEDPRLMAEFEKQVEALYRKHFEAVGEKWPLPEGMSKEEQEATLERVHHKYILKQIENAQAK